MLALAQAASPALDGRTAKLHALLLATPLFRGLDRAAIEDLASRFAEKSRPAGATLLSEEDPGEGLFLILEGRVRAVLRGENGRDFTLAAFGRGDFFGELALLDGRPQSAHLVADAPTTLLVLERESFFDHVSRHPRTAHNLMGELGRRLRRAHETIANLALHDVERRLVRTLERLAREDGGELADGLLLRRRPTQQDLADRVGACRETVSRTLSSLVRRGLIVQTGHSLLLRHALFAERN